jgi:two-component system chemotaxis sensor kinase CheA
MDDLIVEFLTETNESLSALDNDMVRLEQNPNDRDLLSSIFRLMHTIKGTCGFLGLPRLETVAHRAENVLGRFRDGDLKVTPDYVTLILESLDRVRYLLAELEMNGKEPDGNDNDLIVKLDAVYESKGDGSDAPVSTPAAPEIHASAEPEFEPVSVAEITVDSAAPAEKQPEPTADAAQAAGVPREVKESSVANQSIRVNVDVIEHLMTMVSELVLTRNQLLQTLRTNKDSEFSNASATAQPRRLGPTRRRDENTHATDWTVHGRNCPVLSVTWPKNWARKLIWSWSGRTRNWTAKF